MKKYIKSIPFKILEQRKSMFSSDTKIKILVNGEDIWTIVHKSRINDDMIMLDVIYEYVDSMDVSIPGEILQGSRVNTIIKNNIVYKII